MEFTKFTENYANSVFMKNKTINFQIFNRKYLFFFS